MTDTLLNRMACQIAEWGRDEPRNDWWQYQRDHAEAAETILALRKEVEALQAGMKRRDENETRNCINWGPCSLHDGRMTESAALATEEG